jgi:DoxX
MEIFKASVWEIKKSSSLKILGGVLALGHFLQFFFWHMAGELPLRYLNEPAAMCWPMFENCSLIRILPLGLMHLVLYAYGVFALISFFFFIFTRFSGFAFFNLLISFILGFFLYIQDYRLSSNSGYALFLFSGLFLFVPGKDNVFRYFIVSFFVASGLTKLTPEWLSGIWFLQHWSMPAKLGEWLAVLSALVELIAAAALLFRDGRYFWTGWICMFGYMCTLWWATGYFGPTFFLGLLIFLAAQELEVVKAAREYIYQSFIRPEPSKFWCYILLGIFWAGVAAAHFHFPGRQMLLPISSLVTPHSVGAGDHCEQSTYAIFKSRVEEIEVPENSGRPESMRCSPYLRFLDLKALCHAYSDKPEFQTIASFLTVRRLRDAHNQKAFEAWDFCSPGVTFKSLGVQAWNTSIEE